MSPQVRPIEESPNAFSKGMPKTCSSSRASNRCSWQLSSEGLLRLFSFQDADTARYQHILHAGRLGFLGSLLLEFAVALDIVELVDRADVVQGDGGFQAVPRALRFVDPLAC